GFHDLLKRDFDLGIAARRCQVDHLHNPCNMRLNQRPRTLTQHDNRDLATRKVLLILHVLIGGKKQFEVVGLGDLQKISVLVPTLLSRSANYMSLQVRTNWYRRSLIKENSHLDTSERWRLLKTSRCERDHSLHLLTIESVKPLYDVIEACTSF